MLPPGAETKRRTSSFGQIPNFGHFLPKFVPFVPPILGCGRAVLVLNHQNGRGIAMTDLATQNNQSKLLNQHSIMKTINKTIALLFAAAAFTACTKPTIDPLKPAVQPQSIISRPDTLSNPVYLDQENHEPIDFEHKKLVPFYDELTPGTNQPKPTVLPVTQPQTSPASPASDKPIKQIPASDSLIQL